MTASCKTAPFAAPEDAGPAALASVDRAAARPPPPLRAPHLLAPALPDLPELAAHDAPGVAPPGSKPDDHPCGSVWSGTGLVPLMCTKSSLLFGVGEAGAVVIVPDAKMHASLPPLPAVVDHRLEGSEGPVRDQKSSPACTAFAIATAIDHALLRWIGKASAVSSMQLWSRYRTPLEKSAIVSNLGLSLGGEAEWPWNVTEANGWISCPVGGRGKPPAAGCGLPVSEAHRHKVEAKLVATLTHVEYLTDVDAATLTPKLAAGQDIILTLLLPDAFMPKGKVGARYLPHYTKAGLDAGHAVVVAGYVRFAHGTYYLLHNSWGPSWGDGGYAWMHEATVKAWAREAVVVDAEPKLPDSGGRPKRVRGELTCEAGLVPDSIRGACTAPCADGSPRHDGVCPAAGQCAAGLVNLTGACVLASPSGSGVDADTLVRWTCGAGGCAYTVPRTIDKQCTGNSCLVSCPAPDFHLARANGQLTCIE